MAVIKTRNYQLYSVIVIASLSLTTPYCPQLRSASTISIAVNAIVNEIMKIIFIVSHFALIKRIN